MPKCQMVFNLFGMNHLQALMLGFFYAMDKVNELALGMLTAMERNKLKATLPEERAMESDFNLTVKYGFIPASVGRLAISILILRMNNKYIFLMLAVVEMIVLLIASTIHAKYGLDALQYAYLVVIFVQGARWPLAMNIISKWSTATTMTLLLWTFKGSMELFFSLFFQIVQALQPYGIMNVSIYLSIIVKSTFCILWTVFGSADPIHNIFVSKEELTNLKEEHSLRMKCSWRHNPPWKKILTTPILYGCFILHAGYVWFRTWNNNWYLDPFAGFIKSGKWTYLLGYYAKIIASGVAAFGVDFIIKKQITTLNNVRKTQVAVSAWGCGSCIVLIGATLGKDTEVMAFYVLNQIFSIGNGYYDSGLIMYSVSPNYYGFIHCLMSSVAHATLGLRPIVDKSLAKDASKDSTRAMSYLMFFYGFLLYFSCLAMLLSGTSRRREYDKEKAVPWKEDSIVSFP